MCLFYLSTLFFFPFARALPAAFLANSEVMLVGFGCLILNELPLGHRTGRLRFELCCGSSKEFGDQERHIGM